MKTGADTRQRQLSYFEGTWQTTGQILSGEDDGKSIHGLDTYEWLPGAHFLMHTTDVLIGEKRQHVVEVIGYDEEAKMILGRSFGGSGNFEEMSFDLRGDEVLINGATMRFNGRFSEDYSHITGIWERATLNGWSAVMEIHLIKRP